jgi:uncharacterized membrane protein YfhO
MKKITALTISLQLILTALIACNSQEKDIELAKKAQLPVYKEAKNVKYFSSNNNMSKEANYNVKISYPAKDIINFYNEEMSKLGYQPFVEEYYKYADRNWRHYIDGTVKGDPEVSQYNSDWTDEKHIKRATLLLKIYTYKNKSPNVDDFQEDLKVDFQVGPFLILPPPHKGKEDGKI